MRRVVGAVVLGLFCGAGSLDTQCLQFPVTVIFIGQAVLRVIAWWMRLLLKLSVVGSAGATLTRFLQL